MGLVRRTGATNTPRCQEKQEQPCWPERPFGAGIYCEYYKSVSAFERGSSGIAYLHWSEVAVVVLRRHAH